MIRRNRTKNKVIVIALILGITLLYNEFFVYEIQRFNWAGKECTECVKVLLVADPQILGERHENYFGAWFARWDSDRYLSKTFSRAVSHAQPDVIAFLGDLMDEGHISSMQDFSKYKNRFDRIFETPNDIMILSSNCVGLLLNFPEPNSFRDTAKIMQTISKCILAFSKLMQFCCVILKTIYLPGDNDIGGEEDSVSPHKHDRFKFAYSQPDTLTHKSLIFFKVNRMTHYMPNAPKDAFLNDYTERNTTNVILSHMPLLFSPSLFVKNVIKELSPQVIFTAHDHKAMHLSLDTTIDQLSDVWVLPPHETPLYQLRLDMGDIHELQIPTCSYRMGTPNMGYGLAYIDTRDKSIDFTVLWLPERFPKLKGYLWVLFIIMILIPYTLICNCCASSSHVAYSHLPPV